MINSNAITRPHRVSPGPNTVAGIDVSHYEPSVDWKQALASGHRFAFAKATDGEGSVDSKFATHRANAKAASLIFGGYHFFRFSGLSPVQQGDLLLKATGGVLAGELPLTIDIEWDDTTPKYATGKEMDPAAADLALACLEHVEKATGIPPMIYTAASFFQNFPDPERFARFPLWVANYGVLMPNIPAPFTAWKFWQYTDHELVPGTGKIDASWFNGTIDDLKALTKQS